MNNKIAAIEEAHKKRIEAFHAEEMIKEENRRKETEQLKHEFDAELKALDNKKKYDFYNP